MKTTVLRTLLASALVSFCAFGAEAQVMTQEFFETKPNFENCGDDSYQRAIEEGITLGVAPTPPWTSVDPSTGKAIGIDVEINEAALAWMGVTKIEYVSGNFGTLIPSLLSKRIDVVVVSLHVNPDREKTIAFTGPAWWYGPAIVVPKGNPKNIQSYDDLKNVKVGVLLGSGSEGYAKGAGLDMISFQNYAEEFPALLQGRIDALVEDDLTLVAFMQANPDAPLETVQNVEVPDDLIAQGYGYARYGLRKEDCSLRAAYTQALAEIRASGTVSRILRSYNLTDRNLFIFPVQP